ncbi:hypothetical protein SO802_022443 [Lithocarpus litseifolius]|uniref:Uncharacterized protein n=1 Tax=Lithocarpus litseifolius TaxID=425828 RepID=A0AAW2CK27_9ROSI
MGTASSVQPDSLDDVVEVLHLDLGQGSNPKGKQPAHSDTPTGKKKKAINAIMEMKLSKKTRNAKDIDSRKTVKSPDPFSMSSCAEDAVPVLMSCPNKSKWSSPFLTKFLTFRFRLETYKMWYTWD